MTQVLTEFAKISVFYDLSVDKIGEEFGCLYVSRFCAVAASQRHKIGRLLKAKRADLFNSGLSGLSLHPRITWARSACESRANSAMQSKLGRVVEFGRISSFRPRRYRTASNAPGSVRLDAGGLDHLGPLDDFRADERVELLGRASDRDHSQIPELILDLARIERPDEIGA